MAIQTVFEPHAAACAASAFTCWLEARPATISLAGALFQAGVAAVAILMTGKFARDQYRRATADEVQRRQEELVNLRARAGQLATLAANRIQRAGELIKSDKGPGFVRSRRVDQVIGIHVAALGRIPMEQLADMEKMEAFEACYGQVAMAANMLETLRSNLKEINSAIHDNDATRASRRRQQYEQCAASLLGIAETVREDAKVL